MKLTKLGPEGLTVSDYSWDSSMVAYIAGPVFPEGAGFQIKVFHDKVMFCAKDVDGKWWEWIIGPLGGHLVPVNDFSMFVLETLEEQSEQETTED